MDISTAGKVEFSLSGEAIAIFYQDKSITAFLEDKWDITSLKMSTIIELSHSEAYAFVSNPKGNLIT